MKAISLFGKRSAFAASFAAFVCLVVYAARDVMLPFVLALVIAYVLAPLVSRLERRGVSRAWGIIGIYAAFLAVCVFAVRSVIPRIVTEGGDLVRELPELLRGVESRCMPPIREFLTRAGMGGAIDLDGEGREFAIDKLREHAAVGAMGALAFVRAVVGGSIRFIFVFTLTLMLGAYLMLTRESILGFFENFVAPSARPAWHRLLARVDRGMGGVVRGQLIICGINGVLSTIGFALIGLRYWPVFGLIATVFSLVPIFGTVVSSVPAVALALAESPSKGLFVLLWIIAIHQLEANFLNPKVMGKAAEIHPVLVVFALLAGEHTFGVVGALLGVPVMSLVQSIFLHARDELFGKPQGVVDASLVAQASPSD